MFISNMLCFNFTFKLSVQDQPYIFGFYRAKFTFPIYFNGKIFAYNLKVFKNNMLFKKVNAYVPTMTLVLFKKFDFDPFSR